MSEDSVASAMPRWQRNARRIMIAVALVFGAVVIAVAMSGTGRGKPRDYRIRVSAPKGTQSYRVETSDHTRVPTTWPQNPPVGGAHAPIWQNCGFYDRAIPAARGVHSMEHGAVWITFDPQLPVAQKDLLRKLAVKGYVLVSPMAGLPRPVVASAWGYQLGVDSAAELGLERFIASFRAGPQTPEPGAPCSGGATG